MLRFRQADRSDGHNLSQLGKQSFTAAFGHLYSNEALADFLSEHRSKVAYENWIDDPECDLMLAEHGAGKLAGYVLSGPLALPVAHSAKNCLELKHLYVASDAQSGGIGKRLLDHSLAWSKERGAVKVYLGVYSENHGAQRFYQRAGFTKVGEYGFKVGSHTDLEFIMSLTL